MSSRWFLSLCLAFILIGLVKTNHQVVNDDQVSLSPLNFAQASMVLSQRFRSTPVSFFYDDMITNSKLASLFSRIFSNPSAFPNITKECTLQVITFVTALQTNSSWPLQVIDSYGKPTSGIMRGGLLWVGDYQECIESTDGADWKGKYCMIGNPPADPELLDSINLSLKVGVCMPSGCTGNDVASLINFAIENIPKNITDQLPFNLTMINQTYVTCHEPKVLDGPAITAITILSVIFILVVLGTLVDFYQELVKYYKVSYTKVTDEQTAEPASSDSVEIHKGLQVLQTFSIYTNTIKLFKVNKNSEQFDCLNAVRFISIAWIVLGHHYLLMISVNDNFSVIGDWMKRYSFQVVPGAGFAVDTFFLMSGFLNAYIFLKQVGKTKLSKKFMIMYYVHRIWRLIPPYMLVLMFAATLTPYLGDGPFYPKNGFEYNRCRDTWWTNLIFLNNIVRAEQNKTCMGVAWYMANDFQFYALAPIILIPFSKGKKLIGFIISGAMIITSILTTALIINHYPGMEQGLTNSSPDLQNKQFNLVYIKPWCRIGPYALGILLGYLILNKKDKLKLRAHLNLVFHVVSFVFLGLMIWGTYPNVTSEPLDRVSNIMYLATSRIVWSAALGYILIACMTNGGVINRILSWSFWVPLSRLSFPLYLIHYTVIHYHNFTLLKPITMTDQNMIFMFMSNLSFSLVAAYLVSMFFEVPMIGLEKFVFKRH